jgi:transposase
MTTESIDYRVAAESVRAFLESQAEQQAKLQAALPMLEQWAGLQATAAALEARIEKLKQGEHDAKHRYELADIEAGVFKAELDKRRDAARRDIEALEKKRQQLSVAAQ